MPTRFGNVTANLEEYTRSMHGIDHWLWWPRLAPLLPEGMAEITATEVANTTGLLNLSFVGAALGLGGAALLGLAGGLWTDGAESPRGRPGAGLDLLSDGRRAGRGGGTAPARGLRSLSA